jgi:hypothetical protein
MHIATDKVNCPPVETPHQNAPPMRHFERLIWLTTNLSIPAIVAVICAIQAALLLWQNSVVQINDDGILYVRAARLFAEGHFQEAQSVYHWIAYPLLIGAVSFVTGIDAQIAARLLNGLASTLTVLIIIQSAWVSLPRKATIVCAAILLLGNIWFSELRAVIVREHFYFLFMLIGFYCLLRDIQTPGISYKIGFFGATAIAALFRIEAFGFAVFVPLLRLAFETHSRAKRLLTIAAILLAPVGAILLLAYWSDSGSLSSILSKPQTRIDILRDQVLPPTEFRKAALAYSFMIGGLVIYGLVKSIGLMTILPFGYAVSANRRLVRTAPFYLAMIYLGVGILMLSVQTYFNLYLDPRHGLVLSLILTVPAAVGLTTVLQDIPDKQAYPRWVIVLCGAVLLSIGLIAGNRFGDAHKYRMEAGRWLLENTPANATVLSNSNQILFYANRGSADPDLLMRSSFPSVDLASLRDWKTYDWIALELRQNQTRQIAKLEEKIGQTAMKAFENSRGDKILVFKPH